MNRPQQLYPPSYYTKVLSKTLDKEVFKPQPLRLWWCLIHHLVIGLMIWTIITTDAIWLRSLCGLVIGHSVAILTFLGHEILHGSVLRKGKAATLFFGHLCIFHRGLHPKIWIKWHNNAHHHNTQNSIDDPDCFGDIRYLKYSPWLKKLVKIVPGSGKLVSYSFLFYWFTFHLYSILIAKSTVPLEDGLRRKGLVYFFGWNIGIALLCGLFSWDFIVYMYVLPTLTANFIHMVYITTNHFLNPLTEDVNDPLVNSLTVRSNRFIHWLHLNFNYHVEHHLYPGMSPKFAPLIHEKLKEHWPERYNEMSHAKALKLIYSVPKFYEEETIHINPINNQQTPNVLVKG